MIFIQEISIKIEKKVMGYKFIKIKINMRDIGIKIKEMDKED